MDTRWLLRFEAIDPKNLPHRTWKVGIPEWLYRQQQIHGHDKAIGRIRLLPEVLEGERGTKRIYEGWCRPGKEEKCFVYVGKPDHDFKSLTIETPPPPKMVFLVFVLPDGSIDELTWRPHTEESEDCPQGVNGKLIWTLNPK
jgi:hypothetical protein